MPRLAKNYWVHEATKFAVCVLVALQFFTMTRPAINGESLCSGMNQPPEVSRATREQTVNGISTFTPALSSKSLESNSFNTTKEIPEFVFMVATAKRQGASYVEECVESLIEAKITDIVVMNTELVSNPTLNQAMAGKARVLDRPDWLPVSKLDVPFSISLSEEEKEKMAFAEGDDEKRKAWRSKEALDFAHLSLTMLAEYPATPWLVFLQDDAVLKRPQRPEFIKTLGALVRKDSPAIAKLNQRGNVALLFHRYYLQSFAAYALLRYDRLPIDWLLDLHNKQYLGFEKPPMHQFFAHVGSKSTFSNNTSRDVDSVGVRVPATRPQTINARRGRRRQEISSLRNTIRQNTTKEESKRMKQEHVSV